MKTALKIDEKSSFLNTVAFNNDVYRSKLPDQSQNNFNL